MPPKGQKSVRRSFGTSRKSLTIYLYPPYILSEKIWNSFVIPGLGSRGSGILYQPIKFQIEIRNSFSDSLFSV